MRIKNIPNKLFPVIVLLMVVTLFHGGCGKKKVREPNVIVIVLDTLRADYLPFYGHKRNTAPFLSRLAQDNTIFENTYSASSWTAPATASIFTSLYPFQHGVTTGMMASKRLDVQLNRIPGAIDTVTEVLKKHGYKTYGVADNINICEDEGFTQGFDRFRLLPYEFQTKTNRQLKKWAAEIKAQEKYFLYIHYNDCHKPYFKREPWYRENSSEAGDAASRYESEIGYVDKKIEEMYTLFGWDRNTLLIITADHGEEFGDHGGQGHGNNLYSESIRVPLLIQFPGPDRVHRRIGVNASTLDILPTIRAYLGLEPSGTDEGADLMPLVLGRGNELNRRYVYSHLVKHNRDKAGKDSPADLHNASIFQDWKLIYVKKTEKHEQELFNLREDPGEKINRFLAHKRTANRLFAQSRKFRETCKVFPQEFKGVRLTDERIKELKTLGYVK